MGSRNGDVEREGEGEGDEIGDRRNYQTSSKRRKRKEVSRAPKEPDCTSPKNEKPVSRLVMAEMGDCTA